MTRLNFTIALTALGASILSADVSEAQTRSPADALSALRTCRGMTENAARLACFDQAARALDEGEASGDLLVVERAEIEDTRQRLFGLDVSNVRLLHRFGGQGDLDDIETTLSRAYQTSQGGWVFHLADGSIWRQVDMERLPNRVSPGALVRIRRGAIGSYLISVDGARALRVRRDR